MVSRLEAKKAVRRTSKVAAAFIFEAAIPHDVARRRLIYDFLAVFGGETQPVMTHLIETGRLTLNDVQEAEKTSARTVEEQEREEVMIALLLDHLWQSSVFVAGEAGEARAVSP